MKTSNSGMGGWRRAVLRMAGAAALAASLAGIGGGCGKKSGEAEIRTVEMEVRRGPVRGTVSTSGTVQPQNRLEVKPPIGGRVEEILVREGDRVKSGQILAWMSSTERAALLDAARARGEKEMAYWQQVYRPTALVAPIDGEVIVRVVEPGQTVAVGNAVVVLSDCLIVKARVDETDIGKVAVGQDAEVTLDSRPGEMTTGTVTHISYESKMVNNVTMYEVDIRTPDVPSAFRSGMSAQVLIVHSRRRDAVLVSLDAVTREADGVYVTVRTGPDQEEKRRVELGLYGDRYAEVLSGLSPGEKTVVRKKTFSTAVAKAPTSPLMPGPTRRTKAR